MIYGYEKPHLYKQDGEWICASFVVDNPNPEKAVTAASIGVTKGATARMAFLGLEHKIGVKWIFQRTDYCEPFGLVDRPDISELFGEGE